MHASDFGHVFVVSQVVTESFVHVGFVSVQALLSVDSLASVFSSFLDPEQAITENEINRAIAPNRSFDFIMALRLK